MSAEKYKIILRNFLTISKKYDMIQMGFFINDVCDGITVEDITTKYPDLNATMVNDVIALKNLYENSAKQNMTDLYFKFKCAQIDRDNDAESTEISGGGDNKATKIFDILRDVSKVATVIGKAAFDKISKSIIETAKNNPELLVDIIDKIVTASTELVTSKISDDTVKKIINNSLKEIMPVMKAELLEYTKQKASGKQNMSDTLNNVENLVSLVIKIRTDRMTDKNIKTQLDAEIKKVFEKIKAEHKN